MGGPVALTRRVNLWGGLSPFSSGEQSGRSHATTISSDSRGCGVLSGRKLRCGADEPGRRDCWISGRRSSATLGGGRKTREGANPILVHSARRHCRLGRGL